MITLYQTPTPDLEQSIDFYKRCGFKILSENNPSIVSDGKGILEINPAREARAGIKFYKENWEMESKELAEHFACCKIDEGYLLSDPSGVWVYLIESDDPPSYPVEENSFSLLGNYMGLSLESVSIAFSCKFYEKLGFKVVQGTVDSGWILIMHENGTGISIMKPNSCPHLFFNPSFTYFNGGKNDVIIPKIREAGVPITEEVTVFNDQGEVDNIILRDPGGFGFFVFND